MNREAMQQLRLDRRLINRRGWISPADLEKELESLPDVSHKVADDEDAEDGAGSTPAPGAEHPEA